MSARRIALVLATALALAGCGPRSVTLPVRGVAPLNPNEAQESLPVNVRVYPLSSSDRFKAATVDQLWTDAKGVLGTDLLAQPATFTVFPGAAADPAVEQRFEVPDGTEWLGILGMYQRSDAQDQRAIVVPVSTAEGQGLTLTGFTVRVGKPIAP